MEKTSRFLYFSTKVLFVQYCIIAIAALSAAANFTTDQSALLAFKGGISYDPQDILASNWSTATPVCSWVGVSCGRRHQRVTALNLADMGLEGTLSPHVGNLSFLAYFNITSNFLQGDIPKEIGNLGRLKMLSMGHNLFSGSIPSTIFNLSAIVSIVFENNSLSGSLPEDLCSHLQLPELTILILQYNELSGRIPSSLSQCRALQVMSLSYNKFSGLIPREIWNLTSLRLLYIGYNYFDGGEIPKEISNLQSLERLDLGEAGLVGHIQFSSFNISALRALNLGINKLIGNLPADMCSHFAGLEFLSVYRNELMGSIPRDIGNCTSLTEIRFSENNFSGAIPSEIGNLQNMEILALDINNLSGPIPATVFNISQLQTIGLGFNYLSGNLPSEMGLSLPNLEGLFLGRNNLGGTIPHSITNASKLNQLILYSNMFTGSIPHFLGNIGLLERLYLWGNNFTSESSSSELSFLTSLTNCRRLTELWVGLNPLNGILPSTVGNLSSYLERFDASYCGIKGNIPSEIGNLTNLVAISLGSNNLTGFIPTTVKGLTNVQELDFSNNGLQGSLPVDLCYLRNLNTLMLDRNKFSGPLPACLGNITSLRYLYLGFNRLTSNIPENLFNIDSLLYLNLSSNSLSGSIPSELGSLTDAFLIDLSLNQFSGEIPSTIGSMSSLINLYLHHNRLDGSIPESFGSLLTLEFLDLSHNNLTGVIPKSLEALLQLKYFNVSYNRLRGEIPSGGPFPNFTDKSFLSNEALCGAPWLNVPPCHTDSHQWSRKRRMLLLLVYVLVPVTSIMFAMAIIFASVRLRRRKVCPPQTDMSPATSHRRIAYHELLRATNMFSESNLLGTGSFSSVYKGLLPDRTIFAVKVFNLQREGAFRSFDTECDIFRNLRHRNLTKVISSCSTPDFKGLVLEYMPNGTLEKWLYSHNYFVDILKRLEIMIDVACALEYLHHGYLMPVVHCDLKPSNVLLDDDMVGHVSDFGIAKFLCVGDSTAQTKTIATIGYIAPEYGSEGIVSTRCDVYSYGIMLMERFTRTKPTDAMFNGDLSLKRWVNDSLPNAIAEIIDANLIRPNEEHYAAKEQCVSSSMELALRCSAESPEERMNAKEALAALEKIKLQYLTNCRET